MLAYILALAVGFGSLSLYLSAFFLPEIHRKHDLIWSGVGLFYGLILWVCAGRITGGVLLGQIASVTLLGWLGWQTLSLRFAQTSEKQQTSTSATGLQEVIQDKVVQLRSSFQDGSWRIYFFRFLDQLPAQAASLVRTSQGWVEALISTTIGAVLQPQESSAETSSTQASVEPSEKGDRPSSETPCPEAATPQTEISTVFVEPQPSSPKAEFSAEWDDLELEVYPELETVEGISLDQMTHLHERADSKPDGFNLPPNENQDVH
jgi:Ycf66 protein N-terminus